MHRALNAMETHPEYKETADNLRWRLEAIAPIPPEQQPGHEEWSEPATAENAPDNPGVPSDDISAYLPQQDEQPAPDTATAQAPDEPTTTVTYYPISESAARRAKEANSFSDYRQGSATAEYRQYVDEAVKIAERQKSRVDPSLHGKIDGLLDTYARKLAENMNNSFSIDSNTDSSNINLSYPSYTDEMDGRNEVRAHCEALIKENIEYDILVERDLAKRCYLDELVSIMADTLSSRRETIFVDGAYRPAGEVRKRLLSLDSEHLEYVQECLSENTTQVKNIKAYLLTCLWRAPETINHRYMMQVNHDFRNG